MTTRQLPPRPSVEQLKRQAKELLHAAQAKDPSALARFRALPAFSTISDAELARLLFALHDAQSVIAREHGFDSWNALRERVDELTLEFGAAVTQFIEAATDERADRAERLLVLHPDIASANFHTALLLGDASTIEETLTANPALATQPGGPRDWEPLLYLCHDSLRHDTSARRDGLVVIARRLIALGADPNARFPWLHHGVHRPVLWGATRVTRSLPLAALLLDSGADANDGVTLPLAAGSSDLDTLELLHAHGADANQPWATDGSATLYAILHWAAGQDGVRWLLDHGADPDPVFAANGKTPLHAAAMEGWPDAVRILLAHGASPSARDKEFHGTPLVWAAEGSRAPARDGRDHAAVGRLLLAAGSPADWQSGEEPAQAVLDILAEWQRRALANPAETAG